MALQVSSVFKQLGLYDCIKLFLELPLAVHSLFGSVVKKRFGSCVQSIQYWI